jgi:pimeloyl-ACP methyl ester carboxylesterase
MGGYISLEIMRQAPERVIKLALLNTSARTDTPAQIRQRRALVAGARTSDFKALLTLALRGVLHPAHRENPALSELTVRMGLAVGVDGLARQVEAIIARIDSHPNLSAITVPTLVLVGDRDILTPPDRSEELAAGIPHRGAGMWSCVNIGTTGSGESRLDRVDPSLNVRKSHLLLGRARIL